MSVPVRDAELDMQTQCVVCGKATTIGKGCKCDSRGVSVDMDVATKEHDRQLFGDRLSAGFAAVRGDDK